MPVTQIPLDSSLEQENVTLLIGKNVVLKLIEDQESKSLLNDQHVQKFLATEDLAFRDFRKTMDKIMELETKTFLEPTREMREIFIIRRIMSRRKRMPKNLIALIKSRSRKIYKDFLEVSKNMLELEKKLKKINSEVEVLNPITLSACPACKIPFYHERSGKMEFLLGDYKEALRCPTCDTLVNRDDVERINIVKVIPSIEKVWKRNLWFEEYMASIVRSLEGWRTWTSVYVLGMSGVLHEVDVLAIKDGYVLIGECKTGKVKREDVFTFWTKVSDVKSHISLFASISELPETETRGFLQKNPSVTLLEKVGELRKSEILQKMREGVIRRI